MHLKELKNEIDVDVVEIENIHKKYEIIQIANLNDYEKFQNLPSYEKLSHVTMITKKADNYRPIYLRSFVSG
jgi:hypothetical protein